MKNTDRIDEISAAARGVADERAWGDELRNSGGGAVQSTHWTDTPIKPQAQTPAATKFKLVVKATGKQLGPVFASDDEAMNYLMQLQRNPRYAAMVKPGTVQMVKESKEGVYTILITESIIKQYKQALKENASAGATGSSSIATGPAVKVEEEQVDELSPMAHRRYVDAVAQATDDSDDENNPFNDRPNWKNERSINKHFPNSVGKVLQRRVGESVVGGERPKEKKSEEDRIVKKYREKHLGKKQPVKTNESLACEAARRGDFETFTEAMIAHHKEQFAKTGDTKHMAAIKEMRAARGREMLGELDNGPKGRVQTDKINYDKKHVGGHSADPAARRAEQQAASAERAKQRQADSRSQRAADAREADLDQWDVMDAIRSESGVGDPDHFVSYKTGFIDVGGVTVRAAKCRVMTAIDPVEHFGMMPDDPTIQGGPFEEILNFTVYRDPKNPTKLVVRNH